VTIDGSTPGTIYVICYPGFRHARHYTGWTLDLEARLARHRAGTGAALLRAVNRAGIEWVLAGYWPGTPNDEKKLKARGTAAQWCPRCHPAYTERKTRLQKARRARRRAAAAALEEAA
jgi:predicted GIY-YIG superfamily endonuclease